MNLIEQIKVNDTSIDGYQGTYYDENSKYVQVTTDSEGKILEGIKPDGSKHITGDLTVDGSIYNNSISQQIEVLSYFDSKDELEWAQVTLDSSGNVLGGRKLNGTIVEYMPHVFKEASGNKLDVDILELSDSGKKKLKDELDIDSDWWIYDSTLHNNINQIRRRVNKTTPEADAWNTLTHPPILSFLWFADLHDDVTRLKRLLRFADKYPSYYDDIICTGDANDHWNDNFDYWTETGAGRRVLLSLGNHEQAWVSYDEQGRRIVHRDVPQIDLYNKYFRDFVPYQGVVYQEGKVYWYKDYVRNYKTAEGEPTSKTIRLIQVYPTISNASHADLVEHVNWFNEILADAKENGYLVIVMDHYKTSTCTLIPSNFTQIGGTTDGTGMSAFLNAVDVFINGNGEDVEGGGEFICWLTAHSHQDRISYHESYPDQLFLNINCAMFESSYSDTERIAGTRSEDCFNIIGFDIDEKLIKIVRVGANVDYLLRQRNGIVINYETKEIINQF